MQQDQRIIDGLDAAREAILAAALAHGPRAVIGVTGAVVRFSLAQNAPNPFNPSTVIRYQMHEGAKVSISIYNVLGQPVRTVFEGALPAGSHQIAWDGRDNTGHSMSSGTYIYVMTTDKGYRGVNKMMLVR